VLPRLPTPAPATRYSRCAASSPWGTAPSASPAHPGIDPTALRSAPTRRHPDASNPKSATIRHGLLFVSAATPLPADRGRRPHGYSRFRAYAVLEHGGDLRAAARALRELTR
jgi:hypothetical protein